MEEKLVSVIVPVYDSEAYIAGCIESILAQTHKRLELLLIDDGSVDEGGRICDKYASDGRVRVIHRENRGVSSARNYGISMAKGDYVLFVDSDDTIEPEMISHMVKTATDSDAQVVFCGMIYDYADGHSRNYPETPVYLETDGRGAIAEILKDHITMAGPVCKMFRKELLKNDMFPEDLTVAEDALALVGTFLNVDRVVMDMEPFYHYNRREGSLSTSSFSMRDLDVIRSYGRISRMLEGKGLDDEVEFRRIVAHFRVYDKLVMLPEGHEFYEVEKKVHDWIRHHIRAIRKNPYVGKKRKIAATILCRSRALYRKIVMKHG